MCESSRLRLQSRGEPVDTDGMKRLAALALLVIAGACSTATTAQPLPSGSDRFPGETDSVLDVTATTSTTAAAATSCDVVRESLLTGSQSEIVASMQQLKADKSADARAREYADRYLSETHGRLLVGRRQRGESARQRS